MNSLTKTAEHVSEPGEVPDVLVVICENLKLLIAVPLFVGVAVYAGTFLLPEKYESVAIIQAEQATASLVVTAAVLDPVTIKLGIASAATLEEARNRLLESMRVSVGRNDKLLTLTIRSDDPILAQAIAREIVAQTFIEGRPKGAVRMRMERQLAEARQRFESARTTAVDVLKRIEASNPLSGAGGELARGYADLLVAAGAAQTQISALEVLLEGVSESQLVQLPTLPQKAVRPKRETFAFGAVLFTGFALLFYIFLRRTFKRASPVI